MKKKIALITIIAGIVLIVALSFVIINKNAEKKESTEDTIQQMIEDEKITVDEEGNIELPEDELTDSTQPEEEKEETSKSSGNKNSSSASKKKSKSEGPVVVSDDNVNTGEEGELQEDEIE